MLIVGLCAAGFCGALTRFWLGGLVARRVSSRFPWGTFFINVTGSFLLGLTLGNPSVPPAVRTVAGTGFLGAYTTFSTWNLETVRLMRAGSYTTAVANVLASLAVGLAGAAFGLQVARML